MILAPGEITFALIILANNDRFSVRSGFFPSFPALCLLFTLCDVACDLLPKLTKLWFDGPAERDSA